MISKPPSKCGECGSKDFKEFTTGWHCTNEKCGKNYGKATAYVVQFQGNKEWTTKEWTSKIRIDGTCKRVDIDRERGVKISETVKRTPKGVEVLQKEKSKPLKPRRNICF